MNEAQRLQAHVNARIIAKIPTHCADSIVAIVIATPPTLQLLATGHLFELAGVAFVVTAGHAIKPAADQEKTIGISADNGSFMATPGEWLVSGHSDVSDDVLDLAIYRLPSSALPRLQSKRFLRRSDVEVKEVPRRAVFTLCGFPGALAKASRERGQSVLLRPFEYTTYASDDSDTSSLLGFDPQYHLLLDATAKQATLSDGTPAVLRDRSGEAVGFPRGLNGISGCAVWAIGDLDIPVEKWGLPRVVGVQTGVYGDSQLVRATRWRALAALLGMADPGLQRALELWTPTDTESP